MYRGKYQEMHQYCKQLIRLWPETQAFRCEEKTGGGGGDPALFLFPLESSSGEIQRLWLLTLSLFALHKQNVSLHQRIVADLCDFMRSSWHKQRSLVTRLCSRYQLHDCSSCLSLCHFGSCSVCPNLLSWYLHTRTSCPNLHLSADGLQRYIQFRYDIHANMKIPTSIFR